MRCVASYMLASEPGWRVKASDPFLHGMYPLTSMREDPTDLVVAAALKHAMCMSPWPQYVSTYHDVRLRVIDRRRGG